MATSYVELNSPASTRVTSGVGARQGRVGQKEPHIIDVSLVKCSNSLAVRQCDMRVQRTSAAVEWMSECLEWVWVWVFIGLCLCLLPSHVLATLTSCNSKPRPAPPRPLPSCLCCCCTYPLLGLFLLLCFFSFFIYDDRLPISWQAQRVIGRVSRAKSLNSCLTSSLGTAGAVGVLWLWPEDYEKALRLTRKSSLPCHICIFFFEGVNFGSCSKTKCAAYFAALCKCHYRQEAAARRKPHRQKLTWRNPWSYPAGQLSCCRCCCCCGWAENEAGTGIFLEPRIWRADTPRTTTTTTTRARSMQSMSRRKYEKCKTKIWQKLF